MWNKSINSHMRRLEVGIWRPRLVWKKNMGGKGRKI